MSKHEISREEFEKIESPDTLGRCEDLTGRVFGRLKVLKYAGRTNCGKTGWFCECNCGNSNIIGPIEGNSLKAEKVVSCGCYRREQTSKRESKINDIEFINDNVIKVYTSLGCFICDYEDWMKYDCNEIAWRIAKNSNINSGTYYVKGSRKNDGLKAHERKIIYFHRMIMEATEKEQVDHKNGCTLDCRRTNLRKCTPSENGGNKRVRRNNKSGYTGISFLKREQKWRARIVCKGKEYHLGFYNNIEDAIIARRKGEKQYFKDFNVIDSRGEQGEIEPITIDEVVNNILKGVDI